MTVERHTVTDKNGNETEMVGWPAGLREFDVKELTGTTNMDWRCPSCGEVGHFTRLYRSRPSCANMDCRVDRFSVFSKQEHPGNG